MTRDSTDLDAKTTLSNVTCARLPASSLEALAGLRRSEGISILPDGDRSWVFWEAGADQVLRAVLPVEGVELFEHREGAWYRPGFRLPCFEVPEPVETLPLDRAIFPAPFEGVKPDPTLPERATLRLVRAGQARPSTAVFCTMAEVGRWSDSAPSHAIEAVRGAIQGDRALLLGLGLPIWPDSTRYWGDRVLVPIGYEVRPKLTEGGIIEALGGPDLEIYRLIADEAGDGTVVVEAIPFDAFRPLTRAGVRIALRARS